MRRTVKVLHVCEVHVNAFRDAVSYNIILPRIRMTIDTDASTDWRSSFGALTESQVQVRRAGARSGAGYVPSAAISRIRSSLPRVYGRESFRHARTRTLTEPYSRVDLRGIPRCGIDYNQFAIIERSI